MLELGTRRVRHFNVAEHPTGEWTTQQLREATPWCEGPRFLIRDRDGKFSGQFDDVAHACGTQVLLTPRQAPVANSFAERFVRTARQEVLRHGLIVNEEHLLCVLREFVAYYHTQRPHQSLEQRTPTEVAAEKVDRRPAGPVRAEPVLDGLHLHYHRVAG